MHELFILIQRYLAIRSELKTSDLYVKIEKELLINANYHTNSIEGNKATLNQTKLIIDNKEVYLDFKIFQISEFPNLLGALQYLAEN